MSLTYEHIVSRGAHGEIGNGVWDRLREAEREVWFGSDGSGQIKETFVKSIFFTDEQRERWKTARGKAAREDPTPSVDVFPVGKLCGHSPRLSELAAKLNAVGPELEARRQWTLHRIGELMGEALVVDELGEALHRAALELPEAEVLESAVDELGRMGHGIARVERGRRVELIFDHGGFGLLGNRETLVEKSDYAPVGTVIGWTSYMSREVVASLPA